MYLAVLIDAHHQFVTWPALEGESEAQIVFDASHAYGRDLALTEERREWNPS